VLSYKIGIRHLLMFMDVTTSAELAGSQEHKF